MPAFFLLMCWFISVNKNEIGEKHQVYIKTKFIIHNHESAFFDHQCIIRFGHLTKLHTDDLSKHVARAEKTRFVVSQKKGFPIECSLFAN